MDLVPAENSGLNQTGQFDLLALKMMQDSIKQPPPPLDLAQVQQDLAPIPPSKVADTRPGPAKPSQVGMPNATSYQHLHVVCLLYQILVLPLLEFDDQRILVFYIDFV
ncbi:hypothetical protein V6N12_029081 [Hibiscus sabdariffa]|uniref:Uncharacterized protein n=1 Tax=Hibiscus sabdariffa TaxID=183260 RepID=A0ABR2F7N6_9ROSI